MKQLYVMKLTMLMVLLSASCQPPPPPPAQDASVPTSGQPGDNPITLMPTFNTLPERTQVEFLIDNSNSVEDETKGGCEKRLGEGRFDFVRFIAGIFRDSVYYPQNLSIGVGTFGNKYTSLLAPTAISSLNSIPTPDAPVNNTRYTLGIRGALNEMYQDQLAQIRYLIVLTDGEMETETIETVEEELKDQTINYQDSNLHIYIVLLCPRYSQIWIDKINQIDIANVFNGLENVANQLFQDLNGFLPANGLFFLPANNQNLVYVAGYTTSISFSYWNADTSSGNYLGLYHNSQDFSKSLIGLETYTHNVYPSQGCPQHIFTIDPPPSNNWFLYIQPKTFQALELSLKSVNGESLEVVNNNPLFFNLQIYDNLLPEYDLRNYKDCFSIDLVELDGNPLNGFVTPIPYDGFNYLRADDIFEVLHGQLQWYPPQFNSPGQVEIKISLRARDGNSPTWEGIYDLPIKFEAVFSPPNQTPLPNNNPDTSEINIVFTNVASQPRIFLVSDLSQDELNQVQERLSKERGDSKYKFQKVDYTVNNQEASELKFSGNCTPSEDITNEAYLCIEYFSGGTPLTYTYTFETFKYIIENYNFNRLFFVWEESDVSKATAWECMISPIIIECTEPDSMPIIELKK